MQVGVVIIQMGGKNLEKGCEEEEDRWYRISLSMELHVKCQMIVNT